MKKIDLKIAISCAQVINKLKELRESQRLTTSQLAKLTGIAQPNITRMETESSKPNLKTVVIIADALGMEVRIIKKRREN